MGDRAREGLFASLGAAVDGARCLDLFAGTGALGIEALSRGAAECVFVDSNPAAVRTIRENLTKTHLEDRARVIRSDAAAFLRRPPAGPFDLAFLDPPYAIALQTLRTILSLLEAHLDRSAIFVLTRPKRSDTDVIPVDWLIGRRLSYGDAAILVCREGR